MFIVSKTDLKGPEGLVLAILLQALEDLHMPKQELHRMSAAAYFNSGAYQNHLAMLDLPPTLTPGDIMARIGC